MKEIVEFLKKNELTISTMESCSGGFIANSITNVEGASDVFKFGIVAYSNQYKIKFGVSKDTIEKHSVYSIETAKEMAKAISDFTLSNYGLGITGKLNKVDKNNEVGNDDDIFICIYDRDKNTYITSLLKAKYNNRKDNKEYILSSIIELFKDKIF